MLLWLAVALASSPWVGVDPDIRAEVEISWSPQRVTEALSDLEVLSTLFSEDCLKRWALGHPMAGVGARARVSYVPSWMNRRLTLEVQEVRPGVRVELEHFGNRGFLTRFDVAPGSAGGSVVSVVTPLQEPPWPVREIFHLRVKPAWEACYVDAIKNLEAQ